MRIMFSVKLCLIGSFLYFGNINSKKLGEQLLPDNNYGCGAKLAVIEFEQHPIGDLLGLMDLPWISLLEYETPQGRKFYCGGTLISNRYVLTAAHCIQDNLVSVRFGEHHLNTDPDCESDDYVEDCTDAFKVVDIEKKIVYNSITADGGNHHEDIALLRLKEKVLFTEYIFPICLPLTELQGTDYSGRIMTVAGWGTSKNATRSSVKMKNEVRILSNSSCAAYYESYRVNTTGNQLCATGVTGKFPCNGDSGGPLMYHNKTTDSWMAIGVMSLESNKWGSENAPAIYTKVSSFVDWILNNLKP